MIDFADIPTGVLINNCKQALFSIKLYYKIGDKYLANLPDLHEYLQDLKIDCHLVEVNRAMAKQQKTGTVVFKGIEIKKIYV